MGGARPDPEAAWPEPAGFRNDATRELSRGIIAAFEAGASRRRAAKRRAEVLEVIEAAYRSRQYTGQRIELAPALAAVR